MNDYQALKTEKAWGDYFLRELGKNGYHYKDNDWITKADTVRFIHFSPNIEQIVQASQVKVSGGGLMGVVYVTPIRNTGEVHNLGKYIFNTELPQSNIKGVVDCLVFEVSKNQFLQSANKGLFNYVFESYRYADCTVASVDDVVVVGAILVQIKSLVVDLDAVLDVSVFKKLDEFFTKYSFLKHIYFEALNEYLYTRQNSLEAKEMGAQGEVMAKSIKNYLFTAVPRLKQAFSTTHFNTDTQFHISNLSAGESIITDFSSEDLLSFLRARIKYYFEQILAQPRALTGRYLLKLKNHEERYELETCAVKTLWRERGDAVVLGYNTIPKGELGLTPHADIKTYKAKYDNGFVKDLELVNVDIMPELMGNAASVLRIK